MRIDCIKVDEMVSIEKVLKTRQLYFVFHKSQSISLSAERPSVYKKETPHHTVRLEKGLALLGGGGIFCIFPT
jgi:hypothetical protein